MDYRVFRASEVRFLGFLLGLLLTLALSLATISLAGAYIQLRNRTDGSGSSAAGTELEFAGLHWVAMGGQWSEVNDHVVGKGQGAILVASTDEADYRFEATTGGSVIAGSPPSSPQMLFRCEDPLGRCYAVALRSEGAVELLKVASSSQSTILSTREVDSIEREQRVRIEVEGNRIRVWIGDNLAIDLLDKDPIEVGGPGLAVDDGAAAWSEIYFQPIVPLDQ